MNLTGRISVLAVKHKIISSSRCLWFLGFAGGSYCHHAGAAAEFVFHVTQTSLPSFLPAWHSCMGQNIIKMNLVMMVEMIFLAVSVGALQSPAF